MAVTVAAVTASAVASDIEQFPSLSSASSVLNTSKLNFKEMVMKNTNTVTPPETIRTSVTATVPKYLPVVFQKSLSLGNIFSSVFYGGGDDGRDGDGDDGRDGDDGGGGSAISSVLVDSCDRKYDNLYKY
jgi:hypothetical protein